MHSLGKSIRLCMMESFAELGDFGCSLCSCSRHMGCGLPEYHKHNSSMAQQLEHNFATVARLERRLVRIAFEKCLKIKDYNC